jgi:cytoskeleton protein RodZ
MDDFGGSLRQARERHGISLRHISTSTKIAAAALEALERNDLSKLPGGIFSRGIVRSYAIEVGLDPDATVQRFLECFDQERAPTAQSVATSVPAAEAEFEQRRRRATRALTFGAVAIPAVMALVYYLWRVR